MSAVATERRQEQETEYEQAARLERELHTMHPTGRELISVPMVIDWNGPNLGRTCGGFRIVRKQIDEDEE